MADRPICGSADTDSGEPCQRPAGWGTESTIGPCRDHPVEGRPSKFNDERARAAIKAAREAKSLRGCARAATIRHPTLGNWLGANPVFKNQSGDYVEFFTAFMRARATGESLLVEGGLTSDDIDSQHARFLLSTSFDYTETERLQIEEIGSGIDSNELEELADMAEELF